MPTASTQNEYSTRTLALAAALLAAGQSFLRLDREGKIAYFVFADEPSCLSLETAYYNHHLEVDAKKYADAERALKDQLFGGRGQ